MDAREQEALLLARCLEIARCDDAPPLADPREANFVRVAEMLVADRFPAEGARLKRAVDLYFKQRPDDLVETIEVIRRGWVIGLPRMRNALDRMLGGKDSHVRLY